MRRTLMVLSVVLLASAPAMAASSRVQTRDEALAEATSNPNRITTEFADGTQIMEIADGALTVYYFSKPSNDYYPSWQRQKMFATGATNLTFSGSEHAQKNADGTVAFKGLPAPDIRDFQAAFLKLTTPASN